LFTRVPSLPGDLAPGTRVALEVAHIDLLEASYQCRYLRTLEA
jgi:hypothetical protein